MFCGVKAGTILENIRHGRVILRMIWPVPRDAAVGKRSTLVMANPNAAVRMLENAGEQKPITFCGVQHVGGLTVGSEGGRRSI